MPTADPPATAGNPATAGSSGTRVSIAQRATARAYARARGTPLRETLALALVLSGGLTLRLWGARSGLPYVYNVDEAAHFVPRAAAMSWGGLSPHYFANPPALTYLLHALFTVWFGGGRGVLVAYQHHRAELFEIARIAVAVLGVLAIYLLYLLGRCLFDRRVGLLAGALEAVAFLPVFYGHLALNDVPTLVPLTLSLLGSARMLRYGRMRDYLLAGVGLGLGCATKYTAGIALLPLLTASWLRYRQDTSTRRSPASAAHESRGGRGAAVGLALAGAVTCAAFLLANPYALLDFHRFAAGIAHESSLAGEAQGKLGAPKSGGVVYYLWSLTWGLGWAPTLGALGGALAIWRRNVRVGWLLVPPSLLFLGFMGLQHRYYGRWLLPVFPPLCLLAAFFALGAARLAAARLTAAAPDLLLRLARAMPPGLAVLALLGQGLLYSVHSDVVLGSTDTRTSARAWMVEHVPRGGHIVLEPIVRNEWLQERGPGPLSTHAARWVKYAELGPLVRRDGTIPPDGRRATQIEEYELTLAPSLISTYEREGYCWVVSGSTQAGRALSDPARARWAVAYYGALRRAGKLVYRASPYAPGSRPPGFSFDWSFDYYPLSYSRSGPEIEVYRLHGGRCSR